MPVHHNGVTYRAADAHAHIYPGKIAEKATASVGDFYHIPMHNVGLPHVLAQRGGAAGIDRFLVCSVATKVEQVRSINQFIQGKCQKYPQFIGLGAWHQDITDISGEMDDIQARGLRGIKLHPDFQEFMIDDPKMLDVYREAHRRGLPILFHTGDSRTEFSSPHRLMNVIDKLPDFTCIAAHLGGYSEWEEARREALRHQRVHRHLQLPVQDKPGGSQGEHRSLRGGPHHVRHRLPHVGPQGGAGALLRPGLLPGGEPGHALR